jgi:hypothetical protein
VIFPRPRHKFSAKKTILNQDFGSVAPRWQCTHAVSTGLRQEHIMKSVSYYLNSESGAVTVDWVVLTAAIAGLGLATMAVVSGGVEDLSGDLQTQLASQTITSRFAAAASATAALYDGGWLAPGWLDDNTAWVANFSDEQLTAALSDSWRQQYADPSNVNTGTHNEPRYHDEYWLMHNEAVSRGLEIPEGAPTTAPNVG